MVHAFELTLIDGCARLQDLTSQKWLKLRDLATYDHAQQAAELAAHAIAAATGRMKGDDPDEASLGKAFSDGLLSLQICGHLRECRVVALHFHVRWGLDFDAMTTPDVATRGVHIKPIVDAPDGYATYRFDSDMRPVDAMRRFVERWLREAYREPRAKERAERSAERWRGLLAIGGSKGGAPLRVVITGVTGAGKSTFLNALLGREVVPHSSGVCTGTLITLRRARSAADEGFSVTWRSEEDVERLLRDFLAEEKHVTSKRTKIKTAATTQIGEIGDGLDVLEERARFLREKITALGTTQMLRRTPRFRLGLIGQYTRNLPSSWVEAVEAVEVFLDHPLLDHVELIDAPGLRDGDDERQRFLMRAFVGDVAWLYLAPAAERSNTCTKDWQHIQSLAHNDAGVLLMTKADGQPSDFGRSVVDTMAARMLDYRTFGWRRPMEWCSALLPAHLAALGSNANDDALRKAFNDAKLPVLLALPGKTGRRLEDFLVERRQEPEAWKTSCDYALDASRLPAALRRVGRALSEGVIARRVAQGQGELKDAVREAIDHVEEAIAHAEHALAQHDIISAQRNRLSDVRREVVSAANALEILRGQNRATMEGIAARGEQRKVAFNVLITDKLSRLEAAFDDEFKRQSKPIWMSGKRSFSVVSSFEAPLSAAGHESLVNHSLDATKTTGMLANDLLSSYVMFALGSVGDINDEEAFFEWEGTTRDRMWSNVKLRADCCAAGLNAGFEAKLAEIGALAESVLKDVENGHDEHIAALGVQAASLEKNIEENNPALSKAMAEESLRSLASHKIAFAGYLKDLESTKTES